MSANQPLHVLFATAEMAPAAAVGGLAAAAAGLVKELRRQGVNVTVVLPDYSAVALADERTTKLDVPAWVGQASARSGVHDVLGQITLVDVPGIAKPHPYVTADGTGWPDNDKRFFGFAAAVAALSDSLVPDVLHLNDWHTAAALGLVATAVPSVFTIHTLGYQGHADPGWLAALTRHRDLFWHDNAINPLVGALRTADRVVAVSPNYAAEIRTPAAGHGIDDEIRAADRRLVGILNGIDDEIWNPAADRSLPAPYSARTPRQRAASRTELLREMAVDAADEEVVVAMVTRLVDQKGVDLLIEAVPYLDGMGAKLLVLGSGDAALVDALRVAEAQHPQTIVFRHGYDEGLSHRLFAGSDLFAMPSRFEPCGLAQMQAMRYGSLPVVTPVGGLVDTVIDSDFDPANGTGFVARDVSTTALVDALHRATRAVRQPARRNAIRKRAMTHDWSWRGPAAQHIALYRTIS
jgi:starch synthase